MITLSILIPTYNYNALSFVRAMVHQAEAECIDAEVIVGDDGSTEETAWMDEAEQMKHVRIIHAEENIGRARIRNLMADESQGEWLLFVDADAAIPNTFSLKKGLEAGLGAPVVCGGLYHPDINPNPEATLRYTYERQADLQRSAQVRSRHPYSQLSTFNLLVRRDVFMTIRFDERCTDYGYEDTLFGMLLGNDNIPVAHIDNPLVHTGLDSNIDFLKKTETAMHTLHHISHIMQHGSRLLCTVRKLRCLHLTWAMRLFYHLFRRPMRSNLLGSHPNLFVFKLYKLGYFLDI